MELSHPPKSDEDQSWDPHFLTSNPTTLTISPSAHTYFAVQQDSQPVDPSIAPWLSEQFDDATPERVCPRFHPAQISLSAHSSGPGPSTFPLKGKRILLFAYKA